MIKNLFFMSLFLISSNSNAYIVTNDYIDADFSYTCTKAITNSTIYYTPVDDIMRGKPFKAPPGINEYDYEVEGQLTFHWGTGSYNKVILELPGLDKIDQYIAGGIISRTHRHELWNPAETEMNLDYVVTHESEFGERFRIGLQGAHYLFTDCKRTEY